MVLNVVMIRRYQFDAQDVTIHKGNKTYCRNPAIDKGESKA